MLSHEDYTVGWVCALPLEMTAARAMLDETHSNLSQPATDHNAYTLGKINGHNVVITCLPSGVYGTSRGFEDEFHLPKDPVRIDGNGVDIRLGDVVVSMPIGKHSGVVQYDRGKVRFGTLNRLSRVLLTSITRLQMRGKSHSIARILSEIHDTKTIFTCPGQEQDQLFYPTYDHMESEDTCTKCDKQQLVLREQRTSEEPEIHCGDKALAYFFCESSSDDRRTVTAILRGLLYQLIKQRQELIKFLFSRWKEQREKLFTSFDALWAMLINIGHDTASGEKYCIIDALDECDRESQHILRPYPEIGQHLTGFNSKDLASYQKVEEDLQIFIGEKVKELSQKKNYSEKVALGVSQILEEKAEGTFTWELLALNRGKRDNQIIIQMLSFVAISRRPLRVAELSEACQLYHDEDEETRLRFTLEDIEMCRLMIIVQDGIVRLLHKSARDFLVESRGGSLINDLKAHATLVNRCISHVLQSCHSVKDMEHWELKYRNRNNTFLQYAILYWLEHAAFARTEFFVIREHESFFQLESDEREKWLKMYDSTAGYFSRTRIFFNIPRTKQPKMTVERERRRMVEGCSHLQ
ncbi:hypothetical protein V8E54_006155 [Elaphomyces granulatus]